MKLIQDSVIFSGFTVLVFLFCSPAYFGEKVVCSFRSIAFIQAGFHNAVAEKELKYLLRRNLTQYSFGEITGFVCVCACVCLGLIYMPQLTFGTVQFR